MLLFATQFFYSTLSVKVPFGRKQRKPQLVCLPTDQKNHGRLTFRHACDRFITGSEAE